MWYSKSMEKYVKLLVCEDTDIFEVFEKPSLLWIRAM